MMMQLMCLLLVALSASSVLAFNPSFGALSSPSSLTLSGRRGAAAPSSMRCRSSSSSLYALDAGSIEKLEEMRGKFDRLKNVESADAEKERAELQSTVEKYKTYVEIKIMMGKVRMMWKNEASESRKERQLKSFVQLFSGKLELEEVLKEKLGLPFSKERPVVPGVADIVKYNKQIAELEKKLDEVKLTIPEGMSTRDERFFGVTRS